MEKAIKINSISQCNHLLHVKTRHPLISIIELNATTDIPSLPIGLYAILLHDNAVCNSITGWEICDYCDATLITASPHKPISAKWNNILQHAKGCLLIFHPSLLHGTFLEKHIQEFTFFDFKLDEALHLSVRERNIIDNELKNLRLELDWGIDEYSHTILVNRLTLLLNYCQRFYKRQFITRHECNLKLLSQTEYIIETYFLSAKACHHELPSITTIARSLNVSTAYLEALLLHETGYCGIDFIQMKRLQLARKQLLQTNKSIHVIASELGFSSAQYFCSLFKRVTGYTPLEYRLQN